ncbi:MAG: SAM-dependent methyltransferase [Hyphomicrobiales bacterium]|nr:class I SAM-dependent methyltransferase [Hyphomicrobiales bacterium]PCJ91249.1 MAG: SAM-dependent methyltransferase [Hyphomicrobiales bacterium]
MELSDTAGPGIHIDAANVRALTRSLPLMMKATIRFAARLHYGTLKITIPSGEMFVIHGKSPGPNAGFIIHDEAFPARIFSKGDIGVAEGYIDEQWSSPDVATVIELFCVNQGLISDALENHNWFNRIMRMRGWLTRNTRRGSKKNISAHYDLGNAFYSQWLDPSMTYSSALFETGNEGLGEAQTQKYRHLAVETDIHENDQVLEIGCGWGGFAEFAAKEIGCNVTALTISNEQFEFAQKRIFDAGLTEKVKIKFQDYRDEQGVYDRIASIEMFEAVGEQYWSEFFDRMKICLRPGGTAGLQIITIQDRFFASYRSEMDFIQRYIFPGGMLPSPQILKDLGDRVDMKLVSERIFGQDYATTLRLWHNRFLEAWPSIKPLGFDRKFKNLWEYYMFYCEAGFRSGNIDVRQLVYSRPE